MKDTIDKKKGRWYNTIDGYRRELDITWDTLAKMDRKTLKNIIRSYDTEKWREGLCNKSCMRIYNIEKDSIGYEQCYGNNISSILYARA